MIYYKTYLLLLYFILFLNMTTTLLEPASIIAEEAGAELSSIFGLQPRIPMFLPSGGINP